MISKTHEVKFVFFQVHYSETSTLHLPELLKQLCTKPINERQQKINGVDRILYEEAKSYSSYTAFLFTSKRMEAIPQKINAVGKYESLGLTDEEGLAEDVVLACDSSGSIIALQQNRHGIGYSGIEEYIKKCDPNNSITFSPILTLNPADYIESIFQIRKIHLKLAGLKDFSMLQQYGLSVESSMKLQDLLSSPTLELTWSAGRNKFGLDDISKKIITAFKHFFENDTNNTILALDGSIKRNQDSDKTELIDFLTERIYEKADIPINSSKELDRDALFQSACDAIKNNWESLHVYISH